MTDEVNFGKIAWDAYAKAVGGKSFDDNPLPDWDHLGQKQQYGWGESISAVFDHIHHNIQHFDKKYKATANWQQIWDEILAFITSYIAGHSNTTSKSG